jgi:hypothetical protein
LSRHNKVVGGARISEGSEFLRVLRSRRYGRLPGGGNARANAGWKLPELTTSSRGCLLRIDDEMDIVRRIFRDIPEKNQ